MIKNPKMLREFEKQYLANKKVDFEKNMKIYEAMWKHAKELGVFPRKDPLAGIEADIRIARILHRQNSLNKCSKN